MVLGLGKIFGKGKRGRIKEQWNFNSKSILLAAPIICDADKSGTKSIIFGTNEGKVYSLDRDANIRWVYDAKDHLSEADMMFFDAETANSIQSSPTVHDLNGDGIKEIIFGSEMGLVHALNQQGELIWKFKTEGSIRGRIIVQDINGDGQPEVILACGDGNVYVLTNKGELLKKLEVGNQMESTPAILGSHILVGCNNGELVCLNLEGKILWRFKTEDKIIAQPSIGKLFGDDKDCIVFGSFDQHVYALDELGAEIWTYRTNGAIYSKVELRDINNDKQLEVVFGSCDNKVYALKSNGEKLWSYETDFWVVAPIIIADIDNDGKLEIVAGSYDQNIYVLDAKGKYILDYVPGLSGVMQQTGSYTDVMTTEPGSTVGNKIWQYRTEGVVVGCALMDDTKNIVVNTRPGKVNNLAYDKR